MNSDSDEPDYSDEPDEETIAMYESQNDGASGASSASSSTAASTAASTVASIPSIGINPTGLWHSVFINRRGRIPVFKSVINRLFYYTVSGTKTYCKSSHSYGYRYLQAHHMNMTDVQLVNLMQTYNNFSLVHTPNNCWCAAHGFASYNDGFVDV